MNTKTKHATFFSIALALAGAAFIGHSASAQTAIGIQTQAASSVDFTPVSVPVSAADPSTVIWPAIKASAAIVFDPISNQILYQKNANEEHSMASLVKIMTAATADEFLKMNPKLATQTVKVTSRIEANAADRSLIDGSSWYPKDLVNYMLIGSSNKAAESIASNIVPKAAFVSYMNFMTKELGLTSTRFFNETGLPIIDAKTKKESSAGITTAREMAGLLWNIIQKKPGLLDVTAAESVEYANGNGKTVIHVDNTNRLLHDLPIRFGKTGFTQFAGGNLAVVLQKDDASNPYVIVVLNSTEEDRFNDVRALANVTMANFTR
ncbi:MAG TPA: serine hydrolase [Candidatus Paceibacterota bacterium]